MVDKNAFCSAVKLLKRMLGISASKMKIFTFIGIVAMAITTEANVRISEIVVAPNYFFAGATLDDSIIAHENTIDSLVSTNLLDESWMWIDANRVGAGTNSTSILIVPQLLGMTDMPQQLFLKMLDRVNANSNMYDRDFDGSPNVYEINNNTNPYIADYEDAPKTVLDANCEYSTFTNALWQSNPYSIIEVSGEMYFSESIDLPGWPLLITGPTNGYAVIHSSAPIGVFMVDRRQTDHTLIRNIYLTMDEESSFQAGFWVGGNLPWSADAAGASFENVRLRMYNPGTWYYGWHMYGITDTPVRINNCVVSAAGATKVVPVYVYGDSQVVVTNGLNLINMPNEAPTGEYTWSGYSLSDEYSQSEDSDGDGISDYDEIYAYGTDIWLKDTDGDKVNDLIELTHGSSPTNKSEWCYGLTVVLTNSNANIARFRMALYDLNTSDRISDIKEATNQINVVTFHQIVRNGRVPKLHVWSADESCFINLSYFVSGHDNLMVVHEDQLRTLFDNDDDGLPDEWEALHGLSPINALDVYDDNDGDGMINLHEYLADTNPLQPDGSNTLLSVCARSIDDRLEENPSPNAVSLFAEYPNIVEKFEAAESVSINANFWARNIDWSGVSVWNSSGHMQRCATAISRRHILGAGHFPIPANASVFFRGSDGMIYSNKVVAVRTFQAIYSGAPSHYQDIAVGLLDSPLPTQVKSYQLLSVDGKQCIGSGVGLPQIKISQERNFYIQEFDSLYPDSDYSILINSKNPECFCSTRCLYSGSVRGGDSGCPSFLLVHDEPILIGVHAYASSDPSTAITGEKIQELMDELSDAYHIERYDLQYIDLSDFPTLPRGGL